MGSAGGGEDKPVVKLTRTSASGTQRGKGKRAYFEHTHRYYGVDEDGVERLYFECASDEEDAAFRKTDPLWQAALTAFYRRVFDGPDVGLQDALIQINLEAALNKGDTALAVDLIRALSRPAQVKLLGGEENYQRFVRGEPPLDREGEGAAGAGEVAKDG